MDSPRQSPLPPKDSSLSPDAGHQPETVEPIKGPLTTPPGGAAAGRGGMTGRTFTEPKLPRSAQKRRDRMPDVPDHVGVFPSASAIPPPHVRFPSPMGSFPNTKLTAEDARRNMEYIEAARESDFKCGLCGETARGHAAIGDQRYCHGDDDPSPTCYMQATGVTESPLNPSELWDKQGHDLIVRLGARVRELEAALAEWENGREGAWKDAARRLEAERDQLRARADYLNKVVNEAYAKIAVLKDSLADALNYRKFYRDEHKECERLRAIIVAALDANLDHDCGLEGHDQDCSECVLAKLLFDYVKERRDA